GQKVGCEVADETDRRARLHPQLGGAGGRMQDSLGPLFGGAAKFELRGSTGKFQGEDARGRADAGQVLQQDLQTLLAAEEDMVAFEICLAGERLPAVAERAREFLSHVMPRW